MWHLSLHPLSLTVPVVKATWEKDAGFLEFYSDVLDASIPTISLGVPNTERGELIRIVLQCSCIDSCRADREHVGGIKSPSWRKCKRLSPEPTVALTGVSLLKNRWMGVKKTSFQ